MVEELGYEVTPKQSLDGLWRTMHKYIEHHGYSDISLEIEGSQYEFRQHLQKYNEYKAKAKAFDRIVEERNRIGKLMHNKEYPQVFTDEAFWNIDDIIIDTESGERNES